MFEACLERDRVKSFKLAPYLTWEKKLMAAVAVVDIESVCAGWSCRLTDDGTRRPMRVYPAPASRNQGVGIHIVRGFRWNYLPFRHVGPACA